MHNKSLIVISSDGLEVHGLYSDKFPWRSIGDLDIKRATDVRFNNDIQRWEVFLICENRILPDTFEVRSDAIEYETSYLQGRLRILSPFFSKE